MTLPSIIIRKAVLSDIDELVGLLEELFSIEQDFTFNESLQRDGLAMMLDDHKSRCIMVAEIKQKIVGMCSAQMLVSTAKGGMVALIEDMVVNPSYRRQGIGAKLLLSIEKWANTQGARRLQLLADRNNILALKFYEKLNWATTQLICLRKK